MGQMERWKDIIYIRQHPDGPVSKFIAGNLVCSVMFAGDVFNAYARVRVLSMHQAVVVGVRFCEFVIEFLNKCMYL